MLPIRPRAASAAIVKAVYAQSIRSPLIEALERRTLLSAGFGSNVVYPVPAQSKAMTLVDLRGDGKQDIATATASGTVGILLGNSDGTFAAPTTISDGLDSDGGAIVTIVSTELNGNADLIVSQETDQVSILLGEGNGTFEAPEILTLNHKVSAMAVADINGDGKSDLIVGYNYGGGAAFLGNGDGTFGAAKTFNVGVCAVSSINVAQVYVASNHPDLIIGDQDGSVSLLPGNGDGSFGSAHRIYSYDGANFLVNTGDVNNDGKVDVVIAGKESKLVTLLGNGDGTFQSPLTSTIYNGASASVLADINGDGTLDRVTAYSSLYEVGVSLGNGDGTFSDTTGVDVGCQPQAIAVADLNNDGKPDVVALNVQSNNVSVLLNSYPGTAHFRTGQTSQTSNRPYSVALADFSGDGIDDAVVALSDANEIELFPGLGDGAFGTGRTYSVPNDPSFVMTADMNGDGTPDIVVASSQYGTVSVLLNNGNGTFAAPVTTTVANGVSYGVDAIAAADFNGDHKLDLVVADGYSGYVTVLIGNGDGTFENNPASYPLATMGACDSDGHPHAIGVAVGDFNGDNHPDFAVVDTYYNQINVFLNNGSGGFGAPTTDAVGNYPVSLAVGSLHGDGTQDIVTTNANSGTVSVLLGAGNGTFASAVNYTAGTDPTQVVLSDVNGDGNKDILVLNSGEEPEFVTPDLRGFNGTLDILLGNGNGTFKNRNEIALANGAATFAVADLNGDGQPDVAVAYLEGDTLTSLINTYTFPNGPHSASFTLSANLPTANGPGAVASGELIPNGPADLVVADTSSNSIQVFLGNGDGSFKSPVNYSVANDPTSVLIADVNGDGIPDIIVAGASSKDITVFLGNGNGTFKTPIVTSLANYSISYGPESIASGDFTTGKNADLAVATGSGGSVLILLGNGTGSFTAGQTIQLGNSGDAYGVATADLNSGHNIDIVVTDSTENQVGVLLGNGDGTFQAPKEYGVGNYPTGVVIADFNGEPDIVTANEQGNSVSVLLGNGDGTFGAPRNYFAGQYPFALASGDFNGDGKQDVAVLDTAGDYAGAQGQVSVLLGNGDGSFQSRQVVSVGDNPYSSLATAILSGDGEADLIASNDKNNSLSVLLNNTPGGTISTTSGTVTVTGTNTSAASSITYSNGNVIIDIGGTIQSFPADSVQTVIVDLGSGDDTLTVGSGLPPVSINGGTGSDMITDSNTSPDTIFGGTGAGDTIIAGSARSLVKGNGGDDILIAGTFDNGVSSDQLAAAVAAGPAAVMPLLSPVTGVTVRGHGGNNTLAATGHDKMAGGTGNSFFFDAGFSDDTVNGGSTGLHLAQYNPNDLTYNIFQVFDPPKGTVGSVAPAAVATASPLTAGLVTASVNSAGILKIIGTAGSDSISISSDGANIDINGNGTALTPVSLTNLTGVSVKGRAGDDTITIGQSVLLPVTITATSGNDSLTGGGGDNVIISGIGNSTLVGGAGLNLLIPGEFETYSNTSPGNDSLVGGSGGMTIADFAYRLDGMVLSNDGRPDSGDPSLGETMTIAPSVTGILAGTGNDTIVGMVANELLSAGRGDNSVHGGGVNDTISASKGTDSIVVAAEPVALFILKSSPDTVTGVNNPDEDILSYNTASDVLT